MMKMAEIPEYLHYQWLVYFHEYFHDEEEAADEESFGLCESMDECFEKIGDERVRQMYHEFCLDVGVDHTCARHDRDDAE